MCQLGEDGDNEMYRGICKKALIRKERLGQAFYFQNQTNRVGTYLIRRLCKYIMENNKCDTKSHLISNLPLN